MRSRFGRRLLLIFLACALLPTLTIALVSFQSVKDQLTEQAEDRLQTLAQFAGRSIYDRLTTVESDLRSSAPRVASCARAAGGSPNRIGRCADTVNYALDALSLVTGNQIIRLHGELHPDDIRSIIKRAEVGPRRSALVTDAGAERHRFAIVHRPDSTNSPVYLVGTFDPAYLWSDYDGESLPDLVDLALWDPAAGNLLEWEDDSVVVTDENRRRMSRSATGAFQWRGEAGEYRAAYWTFPTSGRFGLPPIRLTLSQAEADVIAPMADFRKSFPLLLLAAVLAVLAFGLNQIRRRIIPLEALHQGTRRLAQHEFDARVEISSGDEIEDLACSFNTMAAQVGQQFAALQTAADIDRAVLSLMDRARIVETALARLPELVTTSASTLTLIDAVNGTSAVIWTRDESGTIHRSPEPIDLGARDQLPIHSTAARVVLDPADPAIPAFALPLVDPHGGPIEIFPFRFGDDIVGALAFRRSSAEETPRATTIHVRHLVDQVAVALGNARMVERVRFLAFYDNLTGLPNRVLCKERLAQALLRAERRKCHVAVCFLDLDQFSSINDSLGHDLGDRLIEQVARRLLAICRDSDTVARIGCDPSAVEVARLGGDEFTVVLPDLTDPQDATRVARRILNSFREPFRLGTHEVFVSTSIGIAVYPEDGGELEDLVKNADVAMYHAKEEGRNNYRMYSPSMNALAVARMQMEQRLRRAVEASEFGLVYQPIINLDSGRVTGAEALVRWNHPDRGVVSPAEFISLSEESGLIVRLGEWIFRAVCEQAKAWREAGRDPIKLSVNVSARQLQDQDLVAMVRQVLADTGLDPSWLVMELTESVLMRPEGQVANSIRALANLGVQFAVDDFGTGYSSLSYLKHFPVGALKIDRAFIRSLPADQDYVAITSAIVALARALEMEVVAEGVETEEQARFLLELGCHRAQGYLIGQPIPAAEFAAFLDSRAHLSLSRPG